jgi:hypothetical protein
MVNFALGFVMRRAASLLSCLPPPFFMASRFGLMMRRSVRRAIAIPVDQDRGGTLSDNLRLFALTYAAGFLTISLFLA